MEQQQDLVPEICILDFETEGLFENQDAILECHVMHVHNQSLEILREDGWILTERFNTNVHKAVQEMHEISGLFDDIRVRRAAGRMFTAGDLDVQLLKFLQGVSPEPRKIMLAGNSVGQFDARFMARYTPKAQRHLHHRVIDVSGFLEMYKLWHTQLPPPAKVHRARADCLMSLDTLRLAREVCKSARHLQDRMQEKFSQESL